MQGIRGKRQKEAVERMKFSQPLFFRFHYARGAVTFRFLNLHAETTLSDTIVRRTPGPGPMALVRGTGGAEPPAPVGSAHTQLAMLQSSLHILASA